LHSSDDPIDEIDEFFFDTGFRDQSALHLLESEEDLHALVGAGVGLFFGGS
jgi:hypothetical protein